MLLVLFFLLDICPPHMLVSIAFLAVVIGVNLWNQDTYMRNKYGPPRPKRRLGASLSSAITAIQQAAFRREARAC